jgi:tetratricopeptide (TPR) repeat protein
MYTIKERLGALLPIILAAAGLLTGCQPPGDRALLNGVQLLEKGRYSEAIENLNKATNLLPTNAIAWNALGLAYHYTGEFAAAENAYNRALSFDRDLTEARFNLGCALLEQEKGEAARTQFTTYLLRHGSSPEVLLKLGSAQLRMRDASGAEKSFQEILRLTPQNAEALNGLGLAKVQRGRPQEASQYFLNARKADPGFAPALLNLAILKHQHLRDRAGALQDYRAYTVLNPPPPNSEAVSALIRSLESEMPAPVHPTLSSPPAQTNVNFVAATQKSVALNTNTSRPTVIASKPEPLPSVTKTQVASNPTRVGATSTPATPTVENVKVPDEPIIKPAQDITIPPRETVKTGTPVESSTASQSQETTTAKPTKRTFLQTINPLNLFHGQDGATGQTFQATSDPATSSASGPAAKTVTEGGASASATRYQYAALAMPSSGNRAEAERAFSRGLQAQTSRKYAQAIEAYREATRLDPAFYEAHYNLALTYSRQNNSAAALPSYEKALAIRPDAADARYNFALLLMQSHFTMDAINEFEKAIAAHPTEARAHLALGNIYAQDLHLPAKARVHYRRVIEIDPRHPQASAIATWLKANP